MLPHYWLSTPAFNPLGKFFSPFNMEEMRSEHMEGENGMVGTCSGELWIS